MMNESKVLKFFKEISAIPRASFNEKAISDYIVEFAKERNLRYIQDDLYNVIVFKEATKGNENKPVLMLQSHTDMVAEKNMGTEHDFDKDPLDLYVEDGFLKAKGTTLGADDGAGVAYMLAVLDNNELSHPALECVFTVQEETGLTGAEKLDTSVLKATQCIGLDGSGEIETYVSSSGGCKVTLTKTLNWESEGSKPSVMIQVRGLIGGHSGVEIDQERGNANKLIGIILKRAYKEFPDMQLVSYSGGMKDNAIARECDAEVIVNDVVGFKNTLNTIVNELKIHFEYSDSGLEVNVIDSEASKYLTKEDTKDIVTLMFMLPYGVTHKSFAIKDLVIASANIGSVRMDDNQITVKVSLRAMQGFIIENMMEQVEELAQNYHFNLTFSAKYPGWVFDEKSVLRDHIKRVYKDLRSTEMLEVATHGGLELGIWKDRLPELDIVSFGPIMYDIHTPDERLDLESFDRTYEFLEAVIEQL